MLCKCLNPCSFVLLTDCLACRCLRQMGLVEKSMNRFTQCILRRRLALVPRERLWEIIQTATIIKSFNSGGDFHPIRTMQIVDALFGKAFRELWNRRWVNREWLHLVTPVMAMAIQEKMDCMEDACEVEKVLYFLRDTVEI